MKTFTKNGIITLSIFGLIGVSTISYRHITGIEQCPMIGILPACYLIVAGYLLLLISPLLRDNIGRVSFYVGIAIVFGLAIVGSTGELTGTIRCPHTQSGLPKCYISALFSWIILVLGILFFKKERRCKKLK